MFFFLKHNGPETSEMGSANLKRDDLIRAQNLENHEG